MVFELSEKKDEPKKDDEKKTDDLIIIESIEDGIEIVERKPPNDIIVSHYLVENEKKEEA